MPVTRSESGVNLSTWEVVVGDGLYHASGEAPVNDGDIKTVHRTRKSVLKANILNRRIMAHNITFRRIFDAVAMTDRHVAKYRFKIPYIISTANIDRNGQTVEGGLFVWDGPATRLDYGLAFQWVTNPWDPAYKQLSYWDGNGWSDLGVSLEPDTRYHDVTYELDIPNAEAFLTIDGIRFNQNIFSQTPKAPDWGTDVEARFQAETISLFPAETGPVPLQRINFKNWSWEWSNDTPAV
ncbi:MAG: hypothetical protein AAF551_00745 [Bacteroidota bacterium]